MAHHRTGTGVISPMTVENSIPKKKKDTDKQERNSIKTQERAILSLYAHFQFTLDQHTCVRVGCGQGVGAGSQN